MVCDVCPSLWCQISFVVAVVFAAANAVFVLTVRKMYRSWLHKNRQSGVTQNILLAAAAFVVAKTPFADLHRLVAMFAPSVCESEIHSETHSSTWKMAFGVNDRYCTINYMLIHISVRTQARVEQHLDSAPVGIASCSGLAVRDTERLQILESASRLWWQMQQFLHSVSWLRHWYGTVSTYYRHVKKILKYISVDWFSNIYIYVPDMNIICDTFVVWQIEHRPSGCAWIQDVDLVRFWRLFHTIYIILHVEYVA